MTDLAGAGRGTGHELDRSTGGARGRVRLAEFLALYGLAPVAGAVLLPANAMFAMLFAVTAVGLVLLGRTPGFAWSIWPGAGAGSTGGWSWGWGC